jgi:hypothetical protein
VERADILKRILLNSAVLELRVRQGVARSLNTVNG